MHDVVRGNARFSLLAPGLVRMEYSPTARFEDRRSVRAMARPDAGPFPETGEHDGSVRLSTGKMILDYTPDGKPFHAGNLRALDAVSGEAFWDPGRVDDENLGGVHVSMDYVKPGLIPSGVHPASLEHHANGIDWSWWSFHGRLHSEPGVTVGDAATLATLFDEVLATRDPDTLPESVRALVHERAKFPPGLLSRAGYFLYNDTPSPLIDPASGWVVERPREQDAMDLYLFYYQRDFRQALRDGRLLFGATPLIPRYTLGLWYSRYPTFSEEEIYQLVETFDRHELPLDMFVLDLEWHKRGWHGWDWDTDHIPTPDRLLSFLLERDIHTTFNVHPSRVPVADERFDAFLAAAGLTCDKDAVETDFRGERTFGEFDVSIPRHAQAFMDVLHKPVQDQGVDFWWIDSDCPVREIAGLDGQLWTNHLYHEHIKANYPERRPMIFSRTPGFGAHRYPFHFTADTWSTWETLENQVEQTLRAGHMGQSFITHDIGGHISTALHIDPELYMRWVQFAVLNPIVRLHSSKQREGVGGERRPWLYGDFVLESFRAAMQWRMSLLPTLYTVAWESHVEGIPMCRSNGLQMPEWEEGYSQWTSYFLGDRIYAAPVVTPGTLRQVLLPPGRWVNALTGALLSSDGQRPRVAVAPFAAAPLHYCRAGCLLVKQPYARRAATRPGTLLLELYPDNRDWNDRFVLYEDDGMSQDHTTGASALQLFESAQQGDGVQLRIGAQTGDFAGRIESRALQLRVTGTRIAHCRVDGAAVPTENADLVLLPPQDMRKPHVVDMVVQPQGHGKEEAR